MSFLLACQLSDRIAAISSVINDSKHLIYVILRDQYQFYKYMELMIKKFHIKAIENGLYQLIKFLNIG